MSKQYLRISMPVSSFRTIPCPYPPGQSVEGSYHIAIANVKELEIDLSLKPNLREVNLKTKTAEAIKEGLTDADGARGFFHIANRGILLAVSNVDFDNKTGLMHLAFGDPESYGVMDGGHTYETIKQAIIECELSGDQFVKLEILAGFDPDVLHYIAQARNTSVSVSTVSIAEHESKFDAIKEAIKGQPYESVVRFKDNTGEIDVREVICLLHPFNFHLYGDGQAQPTQMYRGKEQCLKGYLREVAKSGQLTKPDGYAAVVHLLPDFLRLHDFIIEHMPQLYNSQGLRFGRRREITCVLDEKSKPRAIYPLRFTYEKGDPKKVPYGIPKGLVFPIFAGFRALLRAPQDGKRMWRVDPFDFFMRNGGEIVKTVMDLSETAGQNPNSVGKSTTIWKQVFMNFRMILLDEPESG